MDREKTGRCHTLESEKETRLVYTSMNVICTVNIEYTTSFFFECITEMREFKTVLILYDTYQLINKYHVYS